MIFKLFNKKEKFIGEINNAIEAIETKQTRGIRVFDFILPADTLTKQIEKYCRIIFQDDLGKWREYIVNKVITRLDYQGAKIIIQAEDFTYELRRKIIEDKRPTNTTANIAAEQLFMNTRIEVGNTEDLGLSSVFFYRENKKEAFNKLLDAWDCEYDSYVTLSGNKITHRYVDLVHRLGEFRGKRYEYSRDLEEVQRTVQSDDVYTALYGFGKGEEIGDGYGRRVNFEDVEWKTSLGKPLNKPLGQRYIADDSLLDEWGVPDKNGNMTHSFGIVTFDDEEDPERILEETYKSFLELSQPRVKYSGKVIDLNRLMGMNYDAVSLGDEVLILDLKISGGILIRARVLEYKKDWLNPSNDIITLGNYSNILTSKLLENEKQINKIRDKSGAWDKADFFDKDGLPSQYLKNLIDELNTKMNSTGGYTYFREGKGIEILNKPEDENPTESMMLGGGYIAIADTKKANGEWDYKTFGTGAGFTADVINTGILQGGKVKFDLTNGTLLIGNSIEDYSLLFDGNSLKIRLSDGKTIEETVITKVEEEIEKAPIYEWTKYADDINGTNISDDPLNKKYIGKAYNKNSQIESNDPLDYTWTISNYYVDNKIDNVSNNLDNFQNDVSTTFKDGIIEESEAKAVEKYINTLQSQQQQIYKMHQSIYNNEHLKGTYKVEENTAYNNYITAFNNLIDYINNVISDGKTTTTEKQEVDARFVIYKDRIATYQEKLNNAQEFIQSEIKRKTEEFAQEKADEVQGTVNTQTEELTVNFTSDLQATAESVTNTMRAEYQNADNEVIKAYEKKIEETAETWRLSFTSLQNDINGTNNQLNEVTTFFDFGAENLTIGKTDSKIKMTLQNDKLAIVDNGVESQYFDNQNAYIKNLIVQNDAQLGNHMFKKNGDKTLIQWAGEN